MKAIFQVTIFIFALTTFSQEKKAVTPNSNLRIPKVKKEASYEVLIEKNIIYAEGLSHESVNSDIATSMPLKLDVYAPDNDSGNRPVFMFIHGGGFAGGSKQQGRIIDLANYYTSRGWVFISIDYRLKKNKGTVPQKWLDYSENVPNAKQQQFLAIYPAIRDAKAALRWVVSNADTYNINTNYITVGGGSAGAITAITVGVSNQEDYRDEINTNQDPTLTSTNLEQSYKIRTIVDFWGSKIALYALEEIFGHQRFDTSDPSLFIAHGTEDPTVPFKNAEDLKAIYDANDVPIAYYPLKGKGHGAWGAQINNKSLSELSFDFIVEQQSLIVE